MSNVYVELAQLQQLKLRTQGLAFRAGSPIKRLPLGKHHSRLRGRGLNFEELRQYQHGDDIRTLDWKVTFRTNKPHVRIFSEERDRHIMLLVDQRRNMFFGSQGKTKSVIAAEAAALSAWIGLQQGDRIGAVLLGDSDITAFEPKRSQRQINQMLMGLQEMNHRLGASQRQQDELSIALALTKTASLLSKNTLLVILTDGYDWDDTASRQLSVILQHNEALLLQVTDPLETTLPSLPNLALSDGQMQIQVDGRNKHIAQQFAQHQRALAEHFERLAERHPFALIPMTTTEEVERQLSPWLGQ